MNVLSEKVLAIYEKAYARLKALDSMYCKFSADHIMDNGPAHCVWDDDNVDDYHIKCAIGNCYAHKARGGQIPWEALDILMQSLQELLDLPYEERIDE